MIYTGIFQTTEMIVRTVVEEDADVLGLCILSGAHLHFELLSNGKPTNPVIHSSIKAPQLHGGDLERFRKVVAHHLAEAQREGKPK